MSKLPSREVYICEVCSTPCYGLVVSGVNCPDSFKPMGCLGGFTVIKPVWVLSDKRLTDGKV